MIITFLSRLRKVYNLPKVKQLTAGGAETPTRPLGYNEHNIPDIINTQLASAFLIIKQFLVNNIKRKVHSAGLTHK